MSGSNILCKDIVIWGTRVLGYTAFYYYKDKANIVCYIDNDEQKWGKTLNGIKICPPAVLKDKDATVVLAMRNGIESIKKQLYEDFHIKSYVLFQAGEERYSMEDGQCHDKEIPEDSCVVAFSGGLGNQMFQYALFKNLESQGRHVLADLEAYLNIGVMKFRLPEVFTNINLEICTKEQKKELLRKNEVKGKRAKKFVIYTEITSYGEGRRKQADLSLLNITGGIITGMHQSYKFPESVRDALLNDFQFHSECENKLQRIRNDLLNENAVSVHVRRGDYTVGNNVWVYGDICTVQYYDNAMQYINEKAGDCKFYFFSDDMEWVKSQFDIEDAVYIEDTLFDAYEDWYDMYLMSLCKHNIIANSTFSWWGAWLNQNKEKIVIAPKKWVNICDYEDIYPVEWVRM